MHLLVLALSEMDCRTILRRTRLFERMEIMSSFCSLGEEVGRPLVGVKLHIETCGKQRSVGKRKKLYCSTGKDCARELRE